MNRTVGVVLTALLLAAVVAITACSSTMPESREAAVASDAWPEAIRALDPVSVYTHNMNTVVVLKTVDGVEHGKYIYRPVSSYWPQSGDDGFTFVSDPTRAPEFGVGCEVLEFRRVRE